MEVGFSDLDFNNELRKLDFLPKKLNERAIRNAAVAALRPAKNSASQKVRSIGKGTSEGYSKARFVARSIRVRATRSQYAPGAHIKVYGPDIPVYDRNWKVAGFAKLLAHGSYKTGKRSWRSNGKNTGSVDGIGNFILQGIEGNYHLMKMSFERGVLKEMEKAKRKLGFR